MFLFLGERDGNTKKTKEYIFKTKKGSNEESNTGY